MLESSILYIPIDESIILDKTSLKEEIPITPKCKTPTPKKNLMLISESSPVKINEKENSLNSSELKGFSPVIPVYQKLQEEGASERGSSPIDLPDEKQDIAFIKRANVTKHLSNKRQAEDYSEVMLKKRKSSSKSPMKKGSSVPGTEEVKQDKGQKGSSKKRKRSEKKHLGDKDGLSCDEEEGSKKKKGKKDQKEKSLQDDKGQTELSKKNSKKQTSSKKETPSQDNEGQTKSNKKRSSKKKTSLKKEMTGEQVKESSNKELKSATKKVRLENKIEKPLKVVTRSSVKKQLFLQTDKTEQLTSTAKKASKNTPLQTAVQQMENVNEIISVPEENESVSKKSRKPTMKSVTSIADCTSPKYREPFKYGWRREVVFRNNSTTNAADVYYYTPRGTKLRSRPDIVKHLTNGLSLENFSFYKGSLGINDSNKEILRYSRRHKSMSNQIKSKYPDISDRGDVYTFRENDLNKRESELSQGNLLSAGRIKNKPHSNKDSVQIIVQAEVYNEPSSCKNLLSESSELQNITIQGIEKSVLDQNCLSPTRHMNSENPKPFNSNLNEFDNQVYEVNMPHLSPAYRIPKLIRRMCNHDVKADQQPIVQLEYLPNSYMHPTESYSTNEEANFKTRTENKENESSTLQETNKEFSNIIINNMIKKNIANKESSSLCKNTLSIEQPILVKSKKESNLLRDEIANATLDNVNKEYELKQNDVSPLEEESILPNTCSQSDSDFSSIGNSSNYESALSSISNTYEKIDNESENDVQQNISESEFVNFNANHIEESVKDPPIMTVNGQSNSNNIFAVEIQKIINNGIKSILSNSEDITDFMEPASEEFIQKADSQLQNSFCQNNVNMVSAETTETVSSSKSNETVEISGVASTPVQSKSHNEVELEKLQNSHDTITSMSDESIQEKGSQLHKLSCQDQVNMVSAETIKTVPSEKSNESIEVQSNSNNEVNMENLQDSLQTTQSMVGESIKTVDYLPHTSSCQNNEDTISVKTTKTVRSKNPNQSIEINEVTTLTSVESNLNNEVDLKNSQDSLDTTKSVSDESIQEGSSQLHALSCQDQVNMVSAETTEIVPSEKSNESIEVESNSNSEVNMENLQDSLQTTQSMVGESTKTTDYLPHTSSCQNNEDTISVKTTETVPSKNPNQSIEINEVTTLTSVESNLNNDVELQNSGDSLDTTKSVSDESIKRTDSFTNDVESYHSFYETSFIITVSNELTSEPINSYISDKDTSLETNCSKKIKLSDLQNIVGHINSTKNGSLQESEILTSNVLKSLSSQAAPTVLSKETTNSSESMNEKTESNFTSNSALMISSNQETKSSDSQDSFACTRSSDDNAQKLNSKSDDTSKSSSSCQSILNGTTEETTSSSKTTSENDTSSLDKYSSSGTNSSKESDSNDVQDGINCVEHVTNILLDETISLPVGQAVIVTKAQQIANPSQMTGKSKQLYSPKKNMSSEMDNSSSDSEDDFDESNFCRIETLASRVLQNQSSSDSTDILVKDTNKDHIITTSNETNIDETSSLNINTLKKSSDCNQSSENSTNDYIKNLESISNNVLCKEKNQPALNVFTAMKRTSTFAESDNVNPVKKVKNLLSDVNGDLKYEMNKSKDQIHEKNLDKSLEKKELYVEKFFCQSPLSTLKNALEHTILIENSADNSTLEKTVLMENSIKTNQSNLNFVNPNKYPINECIKIIPPVQDTSNLSEQYTLNSTDLTKNTTKMQEIDISKKFENDNEESFDNNLDSTKNITDKSSGTVDSSTDNLLSEQNSSIGQSNFAPNNESVERVVYLPNNFLYYGNSSISHNNVTTNIRSEVTTSGIDTEYESFKVQLNKNEEPIHSQSNENTNSSVDESVPNIKLVTHNVTDETSYTVSHHSCSLPIVNESNLVQVCPLPIVTESNLVQNMIYVVQNSPNKENKQINSTSGDLLESQCSFKCTTAELQQLNKILDSSIDKDESYKDIFKNLVEINVSHLDSQTTKEYLNNSNDGTEITSKVESQSLTNSKLQRSLAYKSVEVIDETTDYNVDDVSNSPITTPIKQSTPLKQSTPVKKRIKFTLPSLPSASNFTHSMVSFCASYNSLKHIFQYLSFEDLLVARQVCRAWKEFVDESILWKKVQIRNSQMNDFLANILQRYGTEHLVVIKEDDDNWEIFIKAVSKIKNLRVLELCPCPAYVLEEAAKNCSQLEVISALSIKSEIVNIKYIKNLNKPRKLQIRATTKMSLEGDLTSLSEFSNLTHLSLRSIKNLGKKNIEVIQFLQSLQTLELGECSEFLNTFGSTILAKLKNLERLRLEKIQGACCSTDILTSVSKLEKLTELELVNIDVTSGFDESLPKCQNITKLMIIPLYENQSALSNQIILRSTPELSSTLKHFVWGISEELLQFSKAICEYPDDDSIPVLKPIPHLDLLERLNVAGQVGDYEKSVLNTSELDMLPLSSLKKFYAVVLPETQVDILRVPVAETWNLSM